ncbi:helix-turn-helix domain-containing protein [Actinocatenispora sera]|uniref:TetR/AcrR family transcriptional regulator n=1 Tax=Actinocatenispora sera TaxID=390989 RepID=UPI0033DBE618
MTDRRRGGRPPMLHHDDIVAAAIALIDDEGLDALTMRRLGARLNVAAMSLYRHLPSRTAVLAAVVARLAGDAVVPLDDAPPWPEALHRFGTRYRQVLLAHPRAVPLLATHPVDPDTATTIGAGLFDAAHDADVDADAAQLAVQSVAVFVLGHALAQVGIPPGTDAPPPAPTDYYDRWFTAGLTALVHGFTT